MESGIYRAIDANINRAMEGLRVCEDIMRFTLGIADFSEKLKGLRHEVASAAGMFPGEALLDSREVESDSGKFYDLPGEKKRESAGDMLGANIHRAIEAVRSLEEFSKLVQCDNRDNLFQRIRFSLYSLEKQMGSRIRRDDRVRRLRGSLYCIIDSAFVQEGRYTETADQMIKGGAGVIQLRMKGAPAREMLPVARELAEICKQAGLLFIVNDHADIACLAGADGLHLGQEDLPVSEARRIVPASMIIGISTHSPEQAAEEEANGPDYIAVGPVFDTGSKNGTRLEGIGTDAVRNVCAHTGLPVVAIGGITPESAKELEGTGCASVAVISYIYRNGAIKDNCRELARMAKSITVRAADGPDPG